MTLQKRHLAARVGGGLLEGTDDFLVDAPNLLECENVRFDARGALGKRYGDTELSKTGGPSGASLTNTLFEHQGSLGRWHPEGCYVLDEQSTPDEWRQTNEMAPMPARVLTDPLIRTNGAIAKVDMAISGNVACVVWQKGGRRIDPEIFYAFVDLTTLSIISGPTSMGTSGMRRSPRICTIDSGARFALVGQTGTGFGGATGDIHYATYQLSADTYTFSASALITGATAVSTPLNVATDGGSKFVVAYINVADTILQECTNAGATATSATVAGFHAYATLAHTNGFYCSIDADATGGFYRVHKIEGDLATGSTITNLIAPSYIFPSDGGLRATLCQNGDGDEVVAAISAYGLRWDTCGTEVIEIEDDLASVARSGFVPTVSVVGQAKLASGLLNGATIPLAQQIYGATDHDHVDGATGLSTGLVETEETTPRPYGVLGLPRNDHAADFGFAVRGRFLQDKVSASSYGAELPATVEADGWLYFPQVVLVDLLSQEDPQLNRGGIDLVRVKVGTHPAARTATAQSLRLFGDGNGCVSYDGEQMAEGLEGISTLHLIRDSDTGIDLANTTGVAAPDSGGGTGHEEEYIFRLVPRWVDAQGNVHRGAPSPRLIVTADDCSSTNFGVRPDAFGPEILFPPPFPTAVNGDRGGRLQVEVHVSNYTSPNEHWLAAVVTPRQHPTYLGCYSVTFTWQPIYNSSSSALAEHIFSIIYGGYEPAGSSPAGLSKNTVRLYTDTELEARPAPPLLDLTSTQSRLWGLSAEDRLSVVPTKPLVAGFAPEFAPELAIPVAHEGGDCVGIASLIDNVVVFKQRQVYSIFGEPGSAAGTGSTVRRPTLLAADVGCSNVHSIVEGPFGVAFQSERGFMAISAGREVRFIGEAVKDTLGSYVVTSGVLVPSQSEVRWTLDTDGELFDVDLALVWNYRTDAWSLWTDIPCVHACIRNGVYHRITDDASPRAETPGTWSGSFDMKVVTSWFKFGDVQGLQRIWRVLFLLRYYTGFVKIRCAFDYDAGFKDTRQWTEDECLTLSSATRCQLSLDPVYQKCESIQFEITETTDVGEVIDPPTVGRGIELVGIDFMCGVKRGSFRHRMADAAKK